MNKNRPIKSILNAFSMEFFKAIKSKILLFLFLFSFFVAFMIYILFFIIKNPAFAQASVIIRAKASFVGTADWKTFFDILNMLIAIIGFISFGFITTWIFAREFVEKTAKDLMALPIRREYFVVSKLLCSAIFSLILAIFIYLFSFGAAFILKLGELDTKMLIYYLNRYIIITLMHIALIPVLSFLASSSRGYILPLGFIFGILLVSNFIINISENAQYIPWALPLLYAGMTLKEGLVISNVSFIVLVLTGLLGFIGSIYWWGRVDQG